MSFISLICLALNWTCLCSDVGIDFTSFLMDFGPDYMSRAASVCRDDFLPGVTRGEPARLMGDAMNHGRPERA